MKTKNCCLCKQDLPVSRFKKNKSRKDGLQSQCSECHAKYRREHYQKNRQKYLDKSHDRRLQYRKQYHDWLRQQKCVDCGIDDIRVLELDHQRDKEFNVSQKAGILSWESLKKEIDKCEVVCANCHRIRTAEQFNWYAGLM